MEENRRVIHIQSDIDVITARQAGREICRQMGFNLVDQTRITTVISELARNALTYAGQGILTLTEVHGSKRNGLEIVCEDQGPGIPDIDRTLKGGYSTSGGLGRGLAGSKNLMDDFELKSGVGKGTRVVVRKWLK